jgi:hypothetical protein
MEFRFYGTINKKGDVEITSECIPGEIKEFGTVKAAREWVEANASAYEASDEIIWS